MRERKKENPAKIIILVFLSVIVISSLLLSLPIASRGAAPVPFLTALFTATSATCVTGLVVADTAATWSLFGQIIILCLFQIGGLGFMSATAVFFFITSKKISLSHRLLIMQSLSLKDIRGVVRLIRHVLLGTVFFEVLGAVVLWFRFFPEYGLWRGLGMGIFHSVSAFCNAGFDLFGSSHQLSGLSSYSGDAVVAFTLMLLTVIGGLGFFVWEDIWNNRRFSKLHLHSKIVIAVTAILLASGWVFFYFAERGNPATLGGMSFPDSAVTALFQAVMPRSTGFSFISQAELTNASKMAVMLFMLIGGSAGSTSGGIKNTTVAILFLSAIQSLRGKKGLSVYGRSIPEPQIISALSILLFALAICFAGSTAIFINQPELPFLDVVFEMVSAVATCGLSLGITSALSPASTLIVTASMFLGRIGIITFGLAAFLRRNKVEKIKYPDAWIMM